MCLHLLTVMIWSDRYLFLLHVQITVPRQCLWAVFFLFGFQAYRLQLTAPLSMCVFSVSVWDYILACLSLCASVFCSSALCRVSSSQIRLIFPSRIILPSCFIHLSAPHTPAEAAFKTNCRHGKIESWYHQEAITDITMAFHSPVCVTCKNHAEYTPVNICVTYAWADWWCMGSIYFPQSLIQNV